MTVRLRFYFAIILISFLPSCISFSNMQTAKTLEKGKVSGSLGLGVGHSNTLLDGIEGGASGLLSTSSSLRVGLKDNLDVGLRLNSTIVNTVFSVGAKKQLSTEASTIHKAIGLDVTSIGREDRGLALHIPAYFSLHSEDGLHTLYLNPQLFYYQDLSTQPIDNSSIGFANSIGVKFGKKTSLICEFSLMVLQYEGQVQFNRYGNIGIGFNVQ